MCPKWSSCIAPLRPALSSVFLRSVIGNPIFPAIWNNTFGFILYSSVLQGPCLIVHQEVLWLYLKNIFWTVLTLIICSATTPVKSSSQCGLCYWNSPLTRFPAFGLTSSSGCIQHNSQRDPVETCQFMLPARLKPASSISSRITTLLLTKQPAYPLLVTSWAYLLLFACLTLSTPVTLPACSSSSMPHMLLH